MNTFTRKGYGAIYVLDETKIEEVKEIIKQMDEYEYRYLGDDIIMPFSEYPKVSYLHKFDSLNLDALTAICLNKGIVIWCYDNYKNEYAENYIKAYNEMVEDNENKSKNIFVNY